MTALFTAGALALAAAPPALADSAVSSNWAGYAIHRSGTTFTKVQAAWTQPSPRCRPGRRTYSAYWVGLGGFTGKSGALEQTGTEVDCTASGRVSSTAWYELLPAASRPIRINVRPGDMVAAGVTVVGHAVTLGLEDVTTHRSFTKTVQAFAVDVSSAEWIVEAPSVCAGDGSCHTLPLTNFRSTTFTVAQAQSSSGHVGTISDPAWHRTRISLLPNHRQFAAYRRSGSSPGAANPSALSANGDSFEVAFSKAIFRASRFYTVRTAADPVHAAR